MLYLNGPNTQGTNIIYPTFNNLYPHSTQQHFLISMPYLCRYLKSTRLIMITTLSHQVFSMFDIDLFKTAWKIRNFRAEFLEHNSSSDDFTSLANFLQAGYPTTAFEETYRQHIDKVSIAMYGPGDTDLTLMIPMRDPVSLRHDPVFATHKAEEMFLTACCSSVLENDYSSSTE